MMAVKDDLEYIGKIYGASYKLEGETHMLDGVGLTFAEGKWEVGKEWSTPGSYTEPPDGGYDAVHVTDNYEHALHKIIELLQGDLDDRIVDFFVGVEAREEHEHGDAD